MAENPRFAEYATSGAFAIGLTRVQVSSLAMVLGMGGQLYSTSTALERKGLVEEIRDSRSQPFDGGSEFRLTQPGALVLELCRIAGLVNIPIDAIGAEIDGLRRDLDEARGTMRDACLRARSMQARLQEAEHELEEANRLIERQRLELEKGIRLRDGLGGPPPFTLRLRDPLPDMSTADVIAGLSG
jgi:hypothetical protein